MDKQYISNGCNTSGIYPTSPDCEEAYDRWNEKRLSQLRLEDFKEAQRKLMANTKQDVINQIIYPPIMLGTLPETLTKETTMFRNSPDCFDNPAPTPYQYGNKCVAKSTQANIDLQVNMPPAKDPTETARNRLLERAGQASYEKRDEMRKAFNLIPDHAPETLKDFVQRIKDGKFVTDLTEKEQAERTFWNMERMLEEIEWRDPERKEDQAGYEAANDLLGKALNDVSDEIIVKTPEAGLESLRAFQAKTFH